MKIQLHKFNPALKKILKSIIICYEDNPAHLKLKGEIPAVLQDKVDKIMAHDEERITTVGRRTLKAH